MKNNYSRDNGQIYARIGFNFQDSYTIYSILKLYNEKENRSAIVCEFLSDLFILKNNTISIYQCKLKKWSKNEYIESLMKAYNFINHLNKKAYFVISDNSNDTNKKINDIISIEYYSGDDELLKMELKKIFNIKLTKKLNNNEKKTIIEKIINSLILKIKDEIIRPELWEKSKICNNFQDINPNKLNSVEYLSKQPFSERVFTIQRIENKIKTSVCDTIQFFYNKIPENITMEEIEKFLKGID